jgi:hypothetical protein
MVIFGYALAEGEATYRGFMPGAKITMAKHEVAAEQGQSAPESAAGASPAAAGTGSRPGAP